MAELPKANKVAADHLVDFTPPIYNVWKFKERTTGNSHFGNTVAVSCCVEWLSRGILNYRTMRTLQL